MPEKESIFLNKFVHNTTEFRASKLTIAKAN